MDYHPLTKQITTLLEKNRCRFEAFQHDPVTTSEEASKIRPGYTLHQGAKAMLVKIDKKDNKYEYVMFVLPADLRLDSKKIRKELGIKSMRFATEEELDDIVPGLERGAVPPFGNLLNLPVYADKKMLELEKIVFNAGDRRYSVAMKTQDYFNLVHPRIMDIVQ